MSEPLTSIPPDPLQEEFFLTDAARLRRWFPWMHLGSVLRMAFDPRKIMLAMIALLLLSVPNLIRSRMTTGDSVDTRAARRPWQSGYLFQDDQKSVPSSESILADPWSTIRTAVGQGAQTLTPLAEVLVQGRLLIESRFRWGRTSIQILELLWIWMVWAVIGTLLCRLSALDFMGRDASWNEVWRYCRSRFLSSFASPLLPMIGVAAFWFPCVIAGWITRIPGAGEPIVAVGWFFLWLFGGAIALLLLGLTLCWPLMIATVGIEGTDAFDGLSRSYNYLFSRPWYVIWMTCVVLFIGGCTLFGVRWLAVQADYLALMSMGSGAPTETLREFMDQTMPAPVTEMAVLERAPISISPMPVETDLTSRALHVSRGLITLSLHAFAHSFFWVAVTVMFLLLRKSVDSTPLDQLTEDRQTPLGELPIVGMAAAERREQAALHRTGG